MHPPPEVQRSKEMPPRSAAGTSATSKPSVAASRRSCGILCVGLSPKLMAFIHARNTMGTLGAASRSAPTKLVTRESMPPLYMFCRTCVWGGG